MLKAEETYKYLNDFAKYVIQQSRSNLTKQGKNVNKDLYNSLNKEIEVSKNSFRLTFLMEDYAIFQDKGVSGTRKKYNTPFSYKSKMPPAKPITDWVKKRRFQFRKADGKFMSYQQTSYLVRSAIYKNGIKPSLFFTKPFEAAFKNLPDEIIEAFGLDIENLMKHSLKNIK